MELKDLAATKDRIQKALDKIRPALHADGGDAEIVDFTPEGKVILQLKGACGGCAMSMMTLRNGIERVIKNEVPEVVAVEALQE